MELRDALALLFAIAGARALVVEASGEKITPIERPTIATLVNRRGKEGDRPLVAIEFGRFAERREMREQGTFDWTKSLTSGQEVERLLRAGAGTDANRQEHFHVYF